MESKEILVSATKIIFGNIPFAGPALDEIFFEYRGRLKQERLNKFVELLSEYFEKGQNLDLENLKTEDFSDLFEAVIKRVVQTKSEDKHRHFRDILISQIKNPKKTNSELEIFLDLISSLNETQIIILSEYREKAIRYKEYFSQCRVIEEKNIKKGAGIDSSSEQLEKLKEVFFEKENERNDFYKKLPENDLLYNKQILISKGLMNDGIYESPLHSPLSQAEVSEFGLRFLKFLANPITADE